jgi:hypothetical protein
MYVIFCKSGLGMAGIAEVRRLGVQKRYITARMRIVAARASFADGCMDGFSRKARAVMATVAQAGLRCRKPFPYFVLFPVGDNLRIDR